MLVVASAHADNTRRTEVAPIFRSARGGWSPSGTSERSSERFDGVSRLLAWRTTTRPHVSRLRWSRCCRHRSGHGKSSSASNPHSGGWVVEANHKAHQQG